MSVTPIDAARTIACPMCHRKWTRGGWEKLVLVGIQAFDSRENPRELRNCLCGTTLSVEIDSSLSVAIALVNQVAKSLRAVTQQLEKEIQTHSDTMQSKLRAVADERERCARIADDFAKAANAGALRLADFRAMSSQEERFAAVAERIARTIRSKT